LFRRENNLNQPSKITSSGKDSENNRPATKEVVEVSEKKNSETTASSPLKSKAALDR
jgi:hypothetical protein